MTPMRVRTCLVGGGLALTAGLIAAQGSLLGADLPRTALLGTALGAVVGLVPDRSVVGRTAGLVLGLLVAWLGYALRAGLLPDTPSGHAIAAFVVVALLTGVAASTAERVPLWSCLLGAGAMVGAYETTFATTPTTFVSDSVTAATTVLVSAALGLLVAGSTQDVLAGPVVPSSPGRGPAAVPAPRASADAEADAGLEITKSQRSSR